MENAEFEKRFTSLELAVAHLTEAMEELAKTLDPETTTSRSLIESHLRGIRENFNHHAPEKGSSL